MTAPRVSVVVPVFNKAPFLATALDSIVAAVRSYGGAELIVLDHGSTDGSRELLESRYAREAQIADFRGGTIAAVRNHGVRLATGVVLSFIDADCVIPPNYLERLVEVLAATGAAATGAEVVPPPAPGWVEDVWYRLHRRTTDGEQEWIGSANLAVRRDAFDAVGGFDERLVTGEDTELCQRLRDRGYRIYESKQLTAVHLDNAKTLGDFYRKELWRGLGMFGTVRAGAIDKPTAMTVVHVALCAAAVLALAAAPWPIPPRLGAAAGLVLAVPAATLVYRGLGGGSVGRPLRALLLYEVYYAARAAALARIMVRAGR
jgi:glycosyltransferase involved in cell wall biosynthesis